MGVNEDKHREQQTAAPAHGSSLSALGALISAKREQMKLSVHELASMIEVEPAIIEALEAGSWEVDASLRSEIAQILQLKLIDRLY